MSLQSAYVGKEFLVYFDYSSLVAQFYVPNWNAETGYVYIAGNDNLVLVSCEWKNVYNF